METINLQNGQVKIYEGKPTNSYFNPKGETVTTIKGSCKSIPTKIDIVPAEGYEIEFFKQNSTVLFQNSDSKIGYEIFPSKNDNFQVKFRKKKTNYTWAGGYTGSGAILDSTWLINNPDGSQDVRTGGNGSGSSLINPLKEPFEMEFFLDNPTGGDYFFGFAFDNLYLSFGFWTNGQHIQSLSIMPCAGTNCVRYHIQSPNIVATKGVYKLKVLIDGTIMAASPSHDYVPITDFNSNPSGEGSPVNYTKKSPLTTSYRPFIAFSNGHNGTIFYKNLIIKSLKP